MADPRTFTLVSPHMQGRDVEAFQKLLNTRFAAWDIDKRVEPDGEYGTETRFAAQQVCEGLGILHEKAMKRGVTPELRTKIRHPSKRSAEELARGERKAAYRATLRERYRDRGAELAIEFARAHLDVREQRPNRGPKIDRWIRAAGLDPKMHISPSGGVPWCGCFVNACVMAAGVPNGSSFGVAAVERIVQRAKGEIEGWELVDASKGQPGDLACWKGNGPGWQHVELVEERRSAQQYVCIGGNTSGHSNGSQHNGDGVFRNVRTTSAAGGPITVFARPPYAR
jgi:hypothetical protein